MDLVFEMSWYHPANSTLPMMFLIFSLVLPVYLYKKDQRKVRIFACCWGLFAILNAIASAMQAHHHYMYYVDYKNSHNNIRIVEGYITKVEQKANGVKVFQIGSDLFSYRARLGINCQGEIGWGKKYFNVGSYVKMHFFAGSKNNEQFIACLAKLEIKG